VSIRRYSAGVRFRRALAKVAASTVALTCAAAVLGVGPASAVTPHVVYGKPGSVQLVDVEGSRHAGENPHVIFPTHTIRRSPLAPKDRQKICTAFQIWVPATAPATGWVLQTSSPTFCGWIARYHYAGVNEWQWEGAIGMRYHAEFVVTWATKKRKKLARATYDFDKTDDYKCDTRFCFIGAETDNIPYFSFFG
jgi:hypothetical protein